jgi:hypothetical protein
MKDLLQSSRLRAILWILGAIILLLLTFGLGMLVGSRSAAFRAHFGENYVRNFYGEAPPGGGPVVTMQGPPNAHGVIGKVVDVGTSTLSVVDADGDEVSVTVPTSTVIQDEGTTVVIGAIQPNDMVAVIGAPNGEGQIAARFIRVFPAAQSATASSTPSGAY